MLRQRKYSLTAISSNAEDRLIHESGVIRKPLKHTALDIHIHDLRTLVRSGIYGNPMQSL